MTKLLHLKKLGLNWQKNKYRDQTEDKTLTHDIDTHTWHDDIVFQITKN